MREGIGNAIYLPNKMNENTYLYMPSMSSLAAQIFRSLPPSLIHSPAYTAHSHCPFVVAQRFAI